MKLTRSTGYALTGLVYIHRNGRTRPVPAKAIAAACRLPLDYLLKVLKLLVRREVLLSVRGSQGGFKLTRKPGEITLWEIVESIEGDGEAGGRRIREPVGLSAPLEQRVREIFGEVTQRRREVLEGYSLEDLLTGGL